MPLSEKLHSVGSNLMNNKAFMSKVFTTLSLRSYKRFTLGKPKMHSLNSTSFWQATGP